MSRISILIGIDENVFRRFHLRKGGRAAFLILFPQFVDGAAAEYFPAVLYPQFSDTPCVFTDSGDNHQFVSINDHALVFL